MAIITIPNKIATYNWIINSLGKTPLTAQDTTRVLTYYTLNRDYGININNSNVNKCVKQSEIDNKFKYCGITINAFLDKSAGTYRLVAQLPTPTIPSITNSNPYDLGYAPQDIVVSITYKVNGGSNKTVNLTIYANSNKEIGYYTQSSLTSLTLVSASIVSIGGISGNKCFINKDHSIYYYYFVELGGVVTSPITFDVKDVSITPKNFSATNTTNTWDFTFTVNNIRNGTSLISISPTNLTVTSLANAKGTVTTSISSKTPNSGTVTSCTIKGIITAVNDATSGLIEFPSLYVVLYVTGQPLKQFVGHCGM